MLKIKDNVDLKELEKYGFSYNEIEQEYFYSICGSEELDITRDREICLYINNEYYHTWTDENSFDKVYDLIKADLVEKVDMEG